MDPTTITFDLVSERRDGTLVLTILAARPLEQDWLAYAVRGSRSAAAQMGRDKFVLRLGLGTGPTDKELAHIREATPQLGQHGGTFEVSVLEG